MCGRMTLRTSSAEIQRSLGLAAPPDWSPRYNLAPTQDVLAAIAEPSPGDRGGSPLCPVPLRAGRMRWGLIPAWAKEPSIGSRAINARAETIAEKPTFREAFKKRRCLIVADGYYEWQANGKKKQPFHVRPEGGGLVLFAGLWERWRPPNEGDAPPWLTAVVVTRDAIDSLRVYHERMPVALSPEACEAWLDPAATKADLLAAVASPGGVAWRAVPVSARVGNVANDDPDLLAAIG